mgnify:CR=1 FL=1
MHSLFTYAPAGCTTGNDYWRTGNNYTRHIRAVLSLTLVTVQTDYPDCCPYIVQYIAMHSTPTDSRLTFFV